MISEPEELFVWIWLPGQVEPVVAGRVAARDRIIYFNYGRSYLARPDAIPVFNLDLPLGAGVIDPPAGHGLAPSLRDALPDRWGRRVIIHDLLGHRREAINEDSFGEMTFMMHSGSDRIGALDFQSSSARFVPREGENASLQDLQEFADRIAAGEPVPPALDRTILHGSSIGGARPKALLTGTSGGRPRKMIAKFSASNDVFAMVKGEFAAMKLAKAAGLDTAPVEIARVLDRDVLLVERFDRTPAGESAWQRRAMVSALTWTQEHEMSAHHISYQMLAQIIRKDFADPTRDLVELFSRMTFNILVGNTDDHARNHAAFWDGKALSLTPVYDVAPQTRGGERANQAMVIADNSRSSQLALALRAAPAFLLTPEDARRIIDGQIETILTHWPEVCGEAGMTDVERRFFEGRQFLNPYAFDGYGKVPELR
ncbi:type II toxin-antitoxin system HipA family toxin [Roseibium litorale]|uniref:Type II toxin-antitoxin system HipA family toxin n=1 Tax=Roseibium litorale TaxID=2803841 RepID=A0ABR9CP27_9HYPH|nr:type II toxin-antitoxin system HipA family toxin [Roseibium litorale]MBD8892605.1 type II toxin-antitoxin system HipA family toxin [Roseibium litorale]